MGAQLALKVTRKTEELGDYPRRLIVVGNPGPGTGDKDKYRSIVNNDELKVELLCLGVFPKKYWKMRSYFNFVSRMMGSDFKILEGGKFLEADFKVNTPIVAVMG